MLAPVSPRGCAPACAPPLEPPAEMRVLQWTGCCILHAGDAVGIERSILVWNYVHAET